MHGPMVANVLREGLSLVHIGRRLTVLDSTSSTNDEAWQFLGLPDAEGSVVMAEYQSAGKGRLGRSWASPRGASVMCSVLLVKELIPTQGPSLGLAAAIAVRDAILTSTGLVAQIKWPNDLMIGDRKVAGVLVEARQSGDQMLGFVVGMGINCLQHAGHFPESLRGRATSLEMESSSAVDRLAVARALLVGLDAWLAPARRHDLDAIRQGWLERAAPIGQRVHLRHNGAVFSGQVIDIDPLANLVVQLDEGGRRLFNATETSVVELHS